MDEHGIFREGDSLSSSVAIPSCTLRPAPDSSAHCAKTAYSTAKYHVHMLNADVALLCWSDGSALQIGSPTQMQFVNLTGIMTEDVDGHVLDKYELQKRLGKGAYGIVWKAIDRRTKDVVALKKIFDAFRNQTDSQRTFREVMFLQEFGRHPNVIKLFNIHKADNDRDIYLVFEYMEADLHNVIKKMTILKDVHKQYIMCQLFRAIRFLHSGNVLHRDLKPSNVLLDADCRVKLADFGLARSLSSVVLTSGRALFPGTSTINQIERIMNAISRPSRADIESIGSHYALSVLEKMPQRPRKTLDTMINTNNPHALDLIHRLLIFAPHRRLTVEQCLVHPYVVQFHNPADEPVLPYDNVHNRPIHEHPKEMVRPKVGGDQSNDQECLAELSRVG
ncbi:kinase domain protein [Ostertagia ostertagi]